MGIPTSYYTKPISGNPVKNNSGTVLHAGSADPNLVSNVSLITNNTNTHNNYGSKPAFPSSVNIGSSGNLGTAKAISAGKFCNLEEGRYIAKKLTTTIAQQANNFLQSGAADVGKRVPVHKFYGYQRLNITSWNAVTGAATKGANAGATVLASGLDGSLGFAADNAYGPPGELTYLQGGLTPKQDDYKVATNP